MKRRVLLLGLTLLLYSGDTILGQAAQSRPADVMEEHIPTLLLAAKPPMGWNSWDGYGTTVKEADVKANADWLAKHLKPFGWQYVVADMEWFVTNPIPEGNSKTFTRSPGLERLGPYVPL